MWSHETCNSVCAKPDQVNAPTPVRENDNEIIQSQASFVEGPEPTIQAEEQVKEETKLEQVSENPANFLAPEPDYADEGIIVSKTEEDPSLQ